MSDDEYCSQQPITSSSRYAQQPKQVPRAILKVFEPWTWRYMFRAVRSSSLAIFTFIFLQFGEQKFGFGLLGKQFLGRRIRGRNLISKTLSSTYKGGQKKLKLILKLKGTV